MLPTGCWVSSAVRPLADKNKRAKVPDRLALSPLSSPRCPFVSSSPAQSQQGSVSEQTGSPRRHTESRGTALLLLPFPIPQSARLAASHHTTSPHHLTTLLCPSSRNSLQGPGPDFIFSFFPHEIPEKATRLSVGHCPSALIARTWLFIISPSPPRQRLTFNSPSPLVPDGGLTR